MFIPAGWMDSKKMEKPILGYGLIFRPISRQNTCCITFFVTHMAEPDSTVAHSSNSWPGCWSSRRCVCHQIYEFTSSRKYFTVKRQQMNVSELSILKINIFEAKLSTPMVVDKRKRFQKTIHEV